MKWKREIEFQNNKNQQTNKSKIFLEQNGNGKLYFKTMKINHTLIDLPIRPADHLYAPTFHLCMYKD